MKENSAGFTMIELLATIVLLGILMGIAIPAVMNIMQDQRNDTYIKDAIRFVSRVDYKMRSDNEMPVPAYNACIAMNLSYVDDNTFNDAPYEGEYDRGASFVVAKRVEYSDDEYIYYVRLIEKTKTSSYRGVNLVSLDNLNSEKARDTYVSNLTKDKVYELVTYISSPTTFAGLLGESGINCSSVIIYAPAALDVE